MEQDLKCVLKKSQYFQCEKWVKAISWKIMVILVCDFFWVLFCLVGHQPIIIDKICIWKSSPNTFIWACYVHWLSINLLVWTSRVINQISKSSNSCARTSNVGVWEPCLVLDVWICVMCEFVICNYMNWMASYMTPIKWEFWRV